MYKYKFFLSIFAVSFVIKANAQVTGDYKLEKKVINPRNYTINFSNIGSEIVNRYEYSVITKDGDTLQGKGRIKTDKKTGESYVKINKQKVFAKNTKRINVQTKYYNITGETIKTRWFFKIKSNPFITCYSTFPVTVDFAITHIQRHDSDTLIYLYNNNKQSLGSIAEILSINDKAYNTFQKSHKYTQRIGTSLTGINICLISSGVGIILIGVGVSNLATVTLTLASVTGIIPFAASFQTARYKLVKYRSQAISEFMNSDKILK